MLYTRMLRPAIGACVVASAAVLAVAAQTPAVDPAFQKFFQASNAPAASALVDAVVRSGVDFDEAYARLKRGRTYAGPAGKTGQVWMTNRTADGVEHRFAVNVPESYDPSKRYPVRVQLHGGVMMRRSSLPPANAGGIGQLAGTDDQIYIVPFAWDEMPWWSDDQILNLREILDRVKRDYDVDENHVALSGVSDGGTGTYFVAMRDTTPYASFLPLNGFIMVLAAADIAANGPLHPNNLRDKPFFIVNGERDPLYPTRIVDPYVDHLKRGGVALEYHPQAGAGHNTAWWPQVRDPYEAFVRSHPRNPLPDTLTWETYDTRLYGRAHWLVIDKLATAGKEREGIGRAGEALQDLNKFGGPPVADFGARSVGSHVTRVVPGSNADRMGLKAGDALLRLNDETLHIEVEVAEAFETVPPGTKMTLLVVRDNMPVELEGTYEPQIVQPPARELFDRSEPSGRVDLLRAGNTVTATTRGVGAFTLLLSPDQFDFTRPVKVVANGKTVFDGRVKKDLRTLLTYAASDNDRTMLFGAAVTIDLTR
ncbi:MAG TPA: PDZ domain-containing protein, partial [Vicinamibacterales bacterium]|nr:PDZ domain-containing protein [Vicinamibacterales bacterium]